LRTEYMYEHIVWKIKKKLEDKFNLLYLNSGLFVLEYIRE